MLADAEQHRDDAALLRRRHLDFHLRLVVACGNPILAIMIQGIMEVLQKLVFTKLDLSMEQEFIAIHRGIFEALTARDAEAVHRLVAARLAVM